MPYHWFPPLELPLTQSDKGAGGRGVSRFCFPAGFLESGSGY